MRNRIGSIEYINSLMKLNLLCDVDAPPSDNDMLQWDEASGLWETTTSLDGLTLNSPVIAGDWSWTEGVFSTTLDASDSSKAIKIDATGFFDFLTSTSKWLQLSPQTNAIIFGNSTDNPDYPFIGTGLASFGGGVDVTGEVKSGSGRIKNTSRYTTTQTIPVTDDQVFCNGTFTATLPAGVDGQTFRIVNSGTGTITIAPNGAELLTGENASRTLSSKSVIILTYEPTEGWW